MTNLIIIGAGGFGLEVAAYAEDMLRAGRASFSAIHGFLDDTKSVGQKHAGYAVLGPTDNIDKNALYVIAVGTAQSRQELAKKLASRGGASTTIIHPSSYIAKTAKIGAGCVLAPFSFVGPETEIATHCALNIYASAGHESRLGDYCVLAPYATVHGSAILGNCVFMGSHSAVTPKMRIGSNAKIAAGAVVYHELPEGAQAMGNPAAYRKM